MTTEVKVERQDLDRHAGAELAGGFAIEDE
jgi:hypothetical protein